MKTCVVMSIIAVFATSCVSENPRELVRRAGYLTTVPPSTSFGPGNIVRKKKNRYIGNEDVSLRYICSPEYVKFPGPPEKGTGEISDIGSNKNFSFSADNLKNLGLGVSAQYVRNLSIKFSNVEYLEYGDDKQGMIVDSMKGPVCSKYLKSGRKARNAYIVSSAFKADMDYKITYKVPVTATIKSEIIKEISGEFGISVEKDQATIGRGLYYGVTLDPLF